MTEEELKNINAPTKEEISEKKKKINTYIFVAVSSIFNLVFTCALCFAFLFLAYFCINSIFKPEQETLAKFQSLIMWGAVIIAIFISFTFQKWLTKVIIRGFKLQGKLQPDFVARYLIEKK
ncbi:MAG: hypothetical protein KBS84_05910 [Treponema sp.]|nr:hypothetical protein [Candidatus Treponema scatequi]